MSNNQYKLIQELLKKEGFFKLLNALKNSLASSLLFDANLLFLAA